ncbi:RNA-directed DNA polymerase from mobile element jockey [Elysia marginata]|uniref:RNA-directed DNA polymerase from mobile element jockey n=1 Tax=Elysia marginata TaxID=1093978 RepID=A0AAV4HEL0_9GAST|nr:RNA-directed DNA polymerase from mobile element jockey [Elysia marginata]
MTCPFVMEELEGALKVMQNGRSPGPDNITNEMLAYLGFQAKRKILGLFNTSWKTGLVPSNWKKAILIPILKVGKPKNKGNSSRPISLTSCICGTAQVRPQECLTLLEQWTDDWAMTVNAAKTTYSIFSLSTKIPNLRLTTNNSLLEKENYPKYLGVTLDPRLTWCKQIETVQKNAVRRTLLLKKLAGTSWGADMKLLKKTYVGYVRPVMEYGIAAWGTASNFQKIERVQNHSFRIMTGGIKSTPINSMESVTGLESLEDRRKKKIIRAFTDGLASEAVRDGGGAIYIEWPDNSSSKISIPTGKYSTNYKAEAEALQEAAKVLVNSEATHHAKVVLLTDARSVLDALDNTKCPEVNALAQAITTLSLTASKLVLQWISGHVDIFGNDVADQLAKEGGMMEQIQQNPSYNEAKTLINSALDCHWRQEHPQHNSKDAIHKLSGAEQVTILRLRTGHNRLKHHLFSRFKIGDGPNCPCGANRQDAQHVLQDCPLESRGSTSPYSVSMGPSSVTTEPKTLSSASSYSDFFSN